MHMAERKMTAYIPPASWSENQKRCMPCFPVMVRLLRNASRFLGHQTAMPVISANSSNKVEMPTMSGPHAIFPFSAVRLQRSDP